MKYNPNGKLSQVFSLFGTNGAFLRFLTFKLELEHPKCHMINDLEGNFCLPIVLINLLPLFSK